MLEQVAAQSVVLIAGITVLLLAPHHDQRGTDAAPWSPVEPHRFRERGNRLFFFGIVLTFSGAETILLDILNAVDP
jgi:hypothetical protein